MFELENFSYIRFIHPFEWVMLGIYVILLGTISFFIQVKNIREQPLYRYYKWGVGLKIFSSIVFCLIYIYYYPGGDTISYYESSRALVNLGLKDISSYWEVISSGSSNTTYLLFDSSTGYPWPYMFFDSSTFFVAKLISPIVLVAFKSYLVTSVILSWLSFFGLWRLYLMLCRYYPYLEKWLAYGVLFLPSVLFWSSGILKDTLTFTAVCWFIVAFDGLFILRKNRIRNIIVLLITVYMMISIKPYILMSLVPGALVWGFYSYIIQIRSKLLRYAFIPLVYLLSFGIGYGVLYALGDRLGKFSINKMLVTAAITQKDLRQDYYQGSSFDIGEFEPTIAGVAGKAPAAIVVGLYRPFIWEARNMVMIISGFENLIYLLLSLLLLFRLLVDPRRFFRVLMNNPILIFMISYTLLFSVLVGLSTSNFGALVRFKIPFMPAFVTFIIILNFFLSKSGKKYSEIPRR